MTPVRIVRAVAALGLGVGAVVLAACQPAKPSPQSQVAVYGCIGGAQAFTPPAGVQQIVVDAYGAQGGAGENESAQLNIAPGGPGGRATAVIPVMSGETIQVNVGCRGGDASFEVGLTCMPGAGGFNGGARGGNGDGDSGGGGGGASDLRRGGTDLASRVVVAGGGGGGGPAPEGDDSVGGGGAGGGLAGGDGEDNNTNGGHGGGASQGGGGAGGTGSLGNAGVSGGLGVGGRGGDTAVCGGPSQNGGGGGGGGLYGGGGGGIEDTSGGAGGGGGAGFGPAGATFENGVRAGDGIVLIGYVT